MYLWIGFIGRKVGQKNSTGITCGVCIEQMSQRSNFIKKLECPANVGYGGFEPPTSTLSR